MRVEVFGYGVERDGDGVLLAFFAFARDFHAVATGGRLVFYAAEEGFVHFCCDGRRGVVLGQADEATIAQGDVEFCVVDPDDHSGLGFVCQSRSYLFPTSG